MLSGLIKKYGWKVNLKQFNMEVLADLTGDVLVVGICISPGNINMYVVLELINFKAHCIIETEHMLEELHSNPQLLIGKCIHVSITECILSMARLARIEPGHIVVDPMMGTGTIPIGNSKVII
jgi:hypothetical protein